MRTLHLSILIVDSCPDIAKSLFQFLGNFRHTIHVASGGHEAMKSVVQYNPDVILLDIDLPEVHGLDIAKMLHHSHKKPLLIAITGFCAKEDKADAYRTGFDHFLVKPLDQKELLLNLEQKENYVLVSQGGGISSF